MKAIKNILHYKKLIILTLYSSLLLPELQCNTMAVVDNNSLYCMAGIQPSPLNIKSPVSEIATESPSSRTYQQINTRSSIGNNEIELGGIDEEITVPIKSNISIVFILMLAVYSFLKSSTLRRKVRNDV